MAKLEVADLGRRFGEFSAVKGVNFTANEGEFITLLGPSGCGKSTTLWMLAGLDHPTTGRITFGDEVIADAAKSRFVPAEHRDFGLVFQSYALWPHMTVRQNLEFPLKLRGLQKTERNQRIDEALDLVELNGQDSKHPFQLSGGQQQRVALARTLVYRPRLLLLDEPLSNLDAKLRERARVWLRALQRRLGVTTLYVTHDQDEALAMSDRILVMNSGEVIQDAKPEQIYRAPSDQFVADFVGSSNFLEAVASDQGDGFTLPSGQNVLVELPKGLTPGTRLRIGFRPEDVDVSESNVQGGIDETIIAGEVQSISYLGSKYEVGLNALGQEIRIHTKKPIQPGSVSLRIPSSSWMIFPETDSHSSSSKLAQVGGAS